MIFPCAYCGDVLHAQYSTYTSKRAYDRHYDEEGLRLDIVCKKCKYTKTFWHEKEDSPKTRENLFNDYVSWHKQSNCLLFQVNNVGFKEHSIDFLTMIGLGYKVQIIGDNGQIAVEL